MIKKETFIISMAVGCTAAFFLGRFSSPGEYQAPAPQPQAVAKAAPTTAPAVKQAQPAAKAAGSVDTPAPPKALAAVELPPVVGGDSPAKGGKQPKVTIYEVSDFQ